MFRFLTAVAVFVWLGSAAAHAQGVEEWSQWRGPDRDGTARGFKPPSVWPSQLEQAWQREVGLGYSSPIVSGNRVFIFTREDEEEVVRAVRLSDGADIWKHSYAAPCEVNPPAAGHGKGPKSTPLAADGRLFTLGIGGILSAWNIENGELEWRRGFTKRFRHTAPIYGCATSPLYDDGKLIVHLGGDDQGELLALSAATGDVAWGWDGDGPSYASPIMAELSGKRQVITQTQTACVGIDAENGALLWKIPFKTEYDQNAVTPIVYDQSVIVSGYNKGISRYRIELAGEEWHTDAVWENKEVSLYMSSPVVENERLFGFSNRQKGQLFAIDITTGQTLWTSDGRLADNAALTRTGDLVWAQTTQSELIVFRASEMHFEPLTHYKVADTPTWASPLILADGVLVKDEEKLIRWRFPGALPRNTAGPQREKIAPSKRS